MARILLLAPSGFGKTTSMGEIPELGIKGLDPIYTYLLSVTSKPLPFRGSAAIYPSVKIDAVTGNPATPLPVDIGLFKRVISNNPDVLTACLDTIRQSPMQQVILDDMNYIMQDYYMDNALRTGWDAPKTIGFNMNKIFKAIERYHETNKHVIVMAHPEDVIKPDGRIYSKLKTTGKMVDEYVTPEGKFDIVLLGVSRYDSNEKKIVKEFLTNENEQYSSPRSPVGMFDTLTVPNDLGLVISKVNEYYGI